MGLLSGSNRFFFDFVVAFSAGDSPLTFKQAAIGSIWSVIGLFACYRALEPRNAARFTVIVTSGVKLFVFLSYTSTNMSLWEYLLILIIAIAPIVLLLLPPSNQYYGRNQ
jgi:hypothetical protein